MLTSPPNNKSTACVTPVPGTTTVGALGRGSSARLSDIIAPMASSSTSVGNKVLAPGSRITFGTFTFVATAAGELRLVDPTPSIDALTRGMDDLHIVDAPHDTTMGEAVQSTPADLNVEALADCANALLRTTSTCEDHNQVLYALANVVQAKTRGDAQDQSTKEKCQHV